MLVAVCNQCKELYYAEKARGLPPQDRPLYQRIIEIARENNPRYIGA